MNEDFAARPDLSDRGTEASQRLARLYREIGVAAIAAELGVDLDDFAEPEGSDTHKLGRELAA